MYGIHPQEKIECEKCGSHVMFRGFKSITKIILGKKHLIICIL